MSKHKLTRRQALGAAGALVAGSVADTLEYEVAPTFRSARPGWPEGQRYRSEDSAARTRGELVNQLAPRAELVNTLEYEEQAKLKLAPAVYSLVSGGDRAAFDRITLRPRMLVPTLDLDLSVTLFGDTLFAPIVVGPIGNQRRFHRRRRAGDGEGRVGGQER